MKRKDLHYPHQDGTSQAGRIQKALDPGYVLVDERSIKDLLAFAREYSKELSYFNERNELDGDWSGFLGAEDLDALVRYLKNPEPAQRENGQNNRRYLRPHVVLFLTFLELLQHARAQLNDLTRRHLEFYYREALRLTSQKGVADHVHLMIELADRQDQFLLPAGTLFRATPDSQGKDRFYRSDEDLLANRATVASVKSLFAEKKVIGIHEARLNPHEVIELFPNTREILEEGDQIDLAFMAMLVMALGVPELGMVLEPYTDGRKVDATLLKDLDELLKFISRDLFMPVASFRLLMQLKDSVVLEADRQKPINKQWEQIINVILERAGKKRKPDFRLEPTHADDFETNLLRALERTNFDGFFHGLPDVDDIYDLYRLRDRADVVAFVGQSLFMSMDDFSSMMREVEDIYGRWRQSYEILRTAGRKKQLAQPEHVLKPPLLRAFVPDKFDDLVVKTLGAIEFPSLGGRQLTRLDEVYDEITKLETYFHMPAEDFAYVRLIHAKGAKAKPWEWRDAYAILEDAHAAKVVADRQKKLEEIHRQQSFEAMIHFALRDPGPGDASPDSRVFEDLDGIADRQYVHDKLYLEVENFQLIKTTKAKEANGNTATPEEWARVYAILEQAQRRKRKPPEPTAEVENWQNLYAAADASKVQVQQAGEGEPVTPRWRTFGAGHAAEQEKQVAPGRIGFAIASRLLALAEGERTIRLTIQFAEEGYDRDALANAIRDDAPSPFQFLVSTDEGMVAVQEERKKLIETPTPQEPYERALQYVFKLKEQIPPIVPLTSELEMPWPVLQMLLADIPHNGRSKKMYSLFQSLKLEKVHLGVEVSVGVDVSGITNLILQNDEDVLDAKKPFEPFGIIPVVGSSFYFAHPELCSKKLDTLSLTMEWLGVPPDLFDHYKEYKAANPSGSIKNNNSFMAQLKLYDHRSIHDVKKIQLFNETTSEPNMVSVAREEIEGDRSNYKEDLQPIIEEEVLDWRRYWQVQLLAPDFQHTAFIEELIKDPTLKLSPPYTPRMKKLSAGYTASLEIDLTDMNAFGVDQLYHMEPFGYRNLTTSGKPYPLLPQYENEGELFIGIKDFSAPRDLSLLFQLADGSANPDVEPEPVHWWFLSGDRWGSLERGRLLSDTTNGLLNSGIIRFNLPAVEPSTLLPDGLYWIRATVAKNSRSVADTVGIKPQTVRATFEDRDNAPDHLSQPLPPGGIAELADAQPEVSAVHQPYSSFAGRSPELASRFYNRVSERLRHKDRALTCWDYEHMVLETFPEIYKVKCLPAGTSEDPSLADAIQVIVIPDIRGKQPFDPFEPKAPADLLWRIEQFLRAHSLPFARLIVKNPSYVRLQIRITVQFREDADPGYYRTVLDRELQQYLAPWAYDQSAEIVFGNHLNTSLIVNFVEERPYIDYVAGLKIFTSPGGAVKPEDLVIAPDDILVSDRSHTIDLITEEGFEEHFFTGIGYMKIELDFQLAQE